ncbi:SDR family NAD(P)-dependent oxidoreductase [Rhodococcus globerulus]|uniref:SDR family NAD(P)-dependent oxidoreductase n=1 Tax=Rhodococcus globerulus TaxID=33008 RepID=A0ABU4C3P5_RHOGO|nr:SDR family NAD(P)-dependent oxidoreductase [Rhodococcus globerulus]MDV6271126.1 SDR family NAD(P)-dependent oxidoreductase [Rhodococcus globerulus]
MSTDFSARFTGKTIIVTGAGSGIGRATTMRLLAEGATVVGADVSETRLAELMADAGTDRLVGVAGDLTEQATIDEIVSAAGTVDGIASVAGITDNWLPAAEMDDVTWQRVFDVNLTAPMRLTRAVLPQMIERGSGALAYVSSEAGFRSSISGAGYTSSKHALNGFVKSVAFYYGPKGVRANAVAPGGVNTNIDVAFNSSYALERTGKLLETMPTPSVEPGVVAKSLLWLLSDEAENINGVILPSDGGWTTI